MSKNHIIAYNIKYCALQFLYWMLSCSVIPFTGVFLLDKGYSNSQIGVILACGYIVGLLFQPATALLAVRLKSLSPSAFLTRWCVVYMVIIGLLSLCRNYGFILSILYVLYISAENALQPHINSFAFFIEDSGIPIRFGLARGCGSLSWGLTSLLLGVLVTKFSPHVILVVSAIVNILLIILLSTIRTTRVVDSKNSVENVIPGSFFCSKNFICLMFGIMLIYFGFSFIDGFPYQIVLDVGGNHTDMSRITSLLALIEIPAMFGFEFMHKKHGCVKLIVFSAVMFAFRGIFLATTNSLNALYFSNVFHLLSYAIMIPASVRYLNEIIPENEVTKAQAMLTMMMSAGSILSSFTGGWLIDSFSVRVMLSVAAAATTIGCVAVIYSILNRVGN